MESITSSLAYTAAVTYAAKMSTTQTDSSIQGILGGLYFGVGKPSIQIFFGNVVQVCRQSFILCAFLVQERDPGACPEVILLNISEVEIHSEYFRP